MEHGVNVQFVTSSGRHFQLIQFSIYILYLEHDMPGMMMQGELSCHMSEGA